MNRSIQILSILVLLTLVSGVSAQTPEPCAIEIDGPASVDPGTPLVFKVRVTGKLQTATPEFKWWLSLGTISKGEGTDEITIDTAGLAGLTLTATAELTGAPSGCKNVASITTTITLPPPPSCPFDQYGDIKVEDEQARLDVFVIQIFNSAESRGLILMYAGKETFKGEAAYRLQRAKSYLSDFRGLDPSRIIAVDCGFTREPRAILYVVPEGVTSIPGCDSSAQIPLSEVKFTKPRPKSAKKRR
jgi:hypothetical protein